MKTLSVKIISILLLCTVCTIFSSACNNVSNEVDNVVMQQNPDSVLTGKWKGGNLEHGINELEFFSDGTYTSNHPNYEGSYSVDNNRIRLTGVLMESLTYTIEINNDTIKFYSDSGRQIATFTKV